jgi:hypothetical protein
MFFHRFGYVLGATWATSPHHKAKHGFLSHDSLVVDDGCVDSVRLGIVGVEGSDASLVIREVHGVEGLRPAAAKREETVFVDLSALVVYAYVCIFYIGAYIQYILRVCVTCICTYTLMYMCIYNTDVYKIPKTIYISIHEQYIP